MSNFLLFRFNDFHWYREVIDDGQHIYAKIKLYFVWWEISRVECIDLLKARFSVTQWVLKCSSVWQFRSKLIESNVFRLAFFFFSCYVSPGRKLPFPFGIFSEFLFFFRKVTFSVHIVNLFIELILSRIKSEMFIVKKEFSLVYLFHSSLAIIYFASG